MTIIFESCCLENWAKYSEYMEHEIVYGICAIHPMFAHQYSLAVELNLRNALSNKRVVGLGEIGLDLIR
jgi:Tat protein secretion system quality control protein TatD with DNase activity